MGFPVWGQNFHIGQHICVLIKLKNSGFCSVSSQSLTRKSPVWAVYAPLFDTFPPSQNKLFCFYVQLFFIFLTRYYLVWGCRCTFGQHICLLLKLNYSAFIISCFKKWQTIPLIEAIATPLDNTLVSVFNSIIMLLWSNYLQFFTRDPPVWGHILHFVQHICFLLKFNSYTWICFVPRFLPWLNIFSLSVTILSLSWSHSWSRTIRYLFKHTLANIHKIRPTTSYLRNHSHIYVTGNTDWLN